MSAFHSPVSPGDRENPADPEPNEQQVMPAQVAPSATQLEGETSGPNYGHADVPQQQGQHENLPNGVDRGPRLQGRERTLPASVGEHREGFSQDSREARHEQTRDVGVASVSGTAVTEGGRLASEYQRVNACTELRRCMPSTPPHKHHHLRHHNHLRCSNH